MNNTRKTTVFIFSLLTTIGFVYICGILTQESLQYFQPRMNSQNMVNIDKSWKEIPIETNNLFISGSHQEANDKMSRKKWNSIVGLVTDSLDHHVQPRDQDNEIKPIRQFSVFNDERQLDVDYVSNTNSFGNETTFTMLALNHSSNATDTNWHSRKMNILLIISDDMRPQMNAYRGPHHPNQDSAIQMHTPNLDALAKRSLVLTRAYCQFSVCGPSRASFLTSRRPDTTNVWNLSIYWRLAGGNFTTLPQFYKDHGYVTAGLGKIFHPGATSGYDDPISWNVPYYRPIPRHARYWWAEQLSWIAASKERRREHPLHDEQVTTQAVTQIRQYAPAAVLGKEPFFMAVGYKKPHIPFICPEEFFQFYPQDKMENVTNNFYPVDAPDIGWFHPEPGSNIDNEHYNCSYTTNTPLCHLPEEAVTKIRRAYFACVSYIDGEVGKLLDTLKETGLSKSTIVIFVADHGYHLGENGLIGKHTDFEHSTHVPLMVSIPGQTDNGCVSDSIVELVDIFPTVVDASGLGPLPKCSVDSSNTTLCTEGTSLLPLITNPKTELRSGAVSQIVRFLSMGYTLRTKRFRYTEWTNFTNPTTSAEMVWNNITKSELFDHDIDPEENTNYSQHEIYQKHRHELRSMLHKLVNLELRMKELHYFFSFMRPPV